MIIYLAVIFAWFYVAGVGFGWWNKQEWRPWVLVVGGYGAALGVAWWFLRRYLRTWAGPNEDLVRSAYRAYAKRRMRVLKRGLASDVIWHLKGQKARIHDYRGREEVLGFLKKTMELAGGTFQAELRDVIADSDVVWRLESRIGCTGDYRGPKEVLGFIEKMVKHADGTIRAELRDIIADKEYVIGLHVAGGTGQRFEYFHWLVFQICDRKIKEVWHYVSDQDADNTFFPETAQIDGRLFDYVSLIKGKQGYITRSIMVLSKEAARQVDGALTKGT